MRNVVILPVPLLGAIFLASASRLDAQVTTATVVGLVHDSTGGVVPGATVTATHEGTGVSRMAVTDERGEFVFSALPSSGFL